MPKKISKRRLVRELRGTLAELEELERLLERDLKKAKARHDTREIERIESLLGKQRRTKTA